MVVNLVCIFIMGKTGLVLILICGPLFSFVCSCLARGAAGRQTAPAATLGEESESLEFIGQQDNGVAEDHFSICAKSTVMLDA